MRLARPLSVVSLLGLATCFFDAKSVAVGGAGGGTGGGLPTCTETSSYAECVRASLPRLYFRFEDADLNQACDDAEPSRCLTLGQGGGAPVEAPGLITSGEARRLSSGWGYKNQPGDAIADILGEMVGGNLPWTVELWLNAEVVEGALRGWPFLIRAHTAVDSLDAPKLQMFAATDKFSVQHVPHPGEQWQVTFLAPDRETRFVALRFDGNALSVRVNDEAPTSALAKPVAEAGDLSDLQLVLAGEGPAASCAHCFEGTIDEVAIYDRVLTDDEVAAHYAHGIRPVP